MKNLKKILSLTLALAMALSLMTTALAADAGDFTDYGDVTYTEAVDVMTAVGVFNGTGSGNSFDPNGTLTREQAAKIITYMVMGQTQADKLVATIAPFADVSADRWSAGAIAYCASEGIMNGTGNGKFNPTGELTGLQFAKMLLVAIGYDAELEKMTGAAWGLATSKLAYAVELDDGMDDINLTVPMTREQAAQMAFTTMKTPLVEYADKGATISVNGAVVEFGAQKAQYVSVEKTDGTNNAGKIDTATLANGWTLIEFGERYCKDLEKVRTTNSLVQPVRKWTYKNETIGKYAIGEEKVVVVAERDKTLNDILTGKSYMNYSSSDLAVSYVASAATKDTPAVYGYNVFLNGNQLNGSYGTTPLHKGDVVYAYENSAGKVDRVVIARYTLAKIDSVTDSLNTNEKEANASYRVKLVNLDGTSILNANYYDDHSNDNYIINGFASGTYTKDTVLAVAVNPDSYDGIADSYVAEIVTGKPTAVREVVVNNVGAVTDNNGDITIDGTKYPFIARSGDVTVIPDGVTRGFNFDNEYAVYTTKEGYAIGIEGVTAANVDDLYYVTGVYALADDFGVGNKEFYAQRVALADGKTDVVRVEEGSLQIIDNVATITVQSVSGTSPGDVGDNITLDSSYRWAGLYTFHDKKVVPTTVASVSSSKEQKAGNNVLSMIAFDKDETITKDFNATKDGAGRRVTGTNVVGSVEADASRITVANANTGDNRTFYVNDETKFLGVKSKGGDVDVAYTLGGMKLTTANPADTTDVIVVYDRVDGRTAIAVIYAGDSLNVSAYTKDIVYLPSTPVRKSSNSTWIATLYEMNDGGKTVKEDVALDNGNYAQGFYQYKENSDGSLTLEPVADFLATIPGSAYDDETGPQANVQISEVYKDKGFVGDNKFGNVDFKNVTIIDNRTDSKMLSDDFTTPITSISDLRKATDDGCVVTADIYFDDGATFIAVDEAKKADTGNVGFALTTPAVSGGNSITGGGATRAVDVTLESGNATATLTATKSDNAQTIAKSGTDAGKVTLTDNGATVACAISGMENAGHYVFDLTVSQTGKAPITYNVTIDVAKGATTITPSEIRNVSDLQNKLNDGDPGDVFKLEKAMALDDDLTIPEGVTLELKGAMTTSSGKKITVEENATLKVEGAVGAGVANVAGTLDVDGNITGTVETVSGTLKSTDTISKVNNITKGSIEATTKITVLDNVTAGAETVTINAPVDTLADVTSGTVNFKQTIGAVTKISGGIVTVDGNVTGTVGEIKGTSQVTFKGTVEKVTTITAGTVEFKDDVTQAIGSIADGTVTFGGTAEITAITKGTFNVNEDVTFKPTAPAAPAATTEFKIADGKKLILDGDGATIDITNVTLNNSEQGAIVDVKNVGTNNLTVGENQLYQTGGVTAESGTVSTNKTYTKDGNGKFVAGA